MENQHRSINGYRDLTQEEIDAINAIKELGGKVGEMLEILTDPKFDQRCVALAKTNIQQGFFWAVRSIAQPTSFV